MSTAAVSALMAARAFDPDKVRPGDLPPDVVKPSAIKQKTEKDEKKQKNARLETRTAARKRKRKKRF